MKSNLIDKINEIIDQLTNPEHIIMGESDNYLNDADLEEFAAHLFHATAILEKASELLVKSPNDISEEGIDELAAIAQAFDESDDELLQKQASVLDELLLTIGANPKALTAFKKAENDELSRLRAKYRAEAGEAAYTSAKKEHDEQNQAAKAKDAIKEKVKEYRPLQASLSTRYSPDMPGVSLVRVGDNVYQCPITKKIYDFKNGFTTSKGNKVPGTDVSNQTQNLGFKGPEHMQFSTRDNALNKA